MKRLVIDVDNTLTEGGGGDYSAVSPNLAVIGRLRAYKAEGFEIVLATSRNMRTHRNNLGKIVAHTVPVLLDWLRAHDVPYDEIWVGKPWCGEDGFYVDDRAIRPDEFVALDYREVRAVIGDPVDDD